MSPADSLIPDDRAAGMPTELAAVIYEVLDAKALASAFATWARLSERRKKVYCSYVSAPAGADWQRPRCEKAAHRLASGKADPLPMGRTARGAASVVGGIGDVFGGA